MRILDTVGPFLSALIDDALDIDISWAGTCEDRIRLSVCLSIHLSFLSPLEFPALVLLKIVISDVCLELEVYHYYFDFFFLYYNIAVSYLSSCKVIETALTDARLHIYIRDQTTNSFFFQRSRKIM